MNGSLRVCGWVGGVGGGGGGESIKRGQGPAL